MESYSAINNKIDLEKLARQFNNNKKTQSNDIYKKYRKNQPFENNTAINLKSWIGSQADIGTILNNDPDNQTHKISPYYLNASMGINDISGLSMVENINTAPINSKIRKKNNKFGAKKEETGFYSAQGEYAEISTNNDNLLKSNKSDELNDL